MMIDQELFVGTINVILWPEVIYEVLSGDQILFHEAIHRMIVHGDENEIHHQIDLIHEIQEVKEDDRAVLDGMCQVGENGIVW
jgi:hypothetical protein